MSFAALLFLPRDGGRRVVIVITWEGTGIAPWGRGDNGHTRL
jgi:hypothetical protein